jgi:hypothetical protein
MNWDQPSTTEKKPGIGPAQLGTALFLVLTLLVALCYLAIFVNPQMPFNPFPPLVVVVPTATTVAQTGATPTSVPPTFTVAPTFPPTWTPTATATPTNTFTPRPTSTPAPPTSTPKPLPPFSLGWDPIYTSQKLYPGTSGWWSGVAGEVADRNGKPVIDVKVKVWDDRGHAWEVTPGDASRYADEYGTAYGSQGTYAWWEQVLDASCHQSIDVHIQVIRDGKPASGVVNVKTTADCAKNLIIVHFRKNY